MLCTHKLLICCIAALCFMGLLGNLRNSFVRCETEVEAVRKHATSDILRAQAAFKAAETEREALRRQATSDIRRAHAALEAAETELGKEKRSSKAFKGLYEAPESSVARTSTWLYSSLTRMKSGHFAFTRYSYRTELSPDPDPNPGSDLDPDPDLGCVCSLPCSPSFTKT